MRLLSVLRRLRLHTNANNPYDTNHPYANALLGTYNSYQENKTRPTQDIRGLDLEWYVQDTWKATRRLTLELRHPILLLHSLAPGEWPRLEFRPSLYDPAKAVQLYRPVLNAQGQQVAQNPSTGELLPQGFIGSIVPGSGNINNGLVSAKAPGVPEGFMYNRGVQYGPRFGFAYALTKDKKTVLRGGFGIAYSGHDNQSLIVGTVSIPARPLRNLTALSIPSPRPRGDLPQLIQRDQSTHEGSYHLQLQPRHATLYRQGTLVDAAYVGTLGRHLAEPQNAFNAVAPGSQFLPQNQDPTNPGLPLPDDFFRPYRGISSITVQQFVNSNYNALQLTAVHRFSKNLELNGNYSWSKSLGYYPPFATYYNNKLQYGVLPFDRTHVVRVYYVYTLPKFSGHWKVGAAHWVLDNWQVSGISTFESGVPESLNCQFTYPVNLFGGGDYSRCNLTGPVHLGQ